MPRITDYSFLFQDMLGKTGTNLVGSFKLSQINSSSVQAQLKAAGININSKQYKATLGVMMKNGNGMMYANIQGIKNLMSQYDEADVGWKIGKPIKVGILDSITREIVETKIHISKSVDVKI